MKNSLIWIGNGYPNPQTWALKKEMPVHLQNEALLVQFRFCTCYVAMDHEHRVLMRDGQRMPLIEIFTHDGKRLTGPRDLAAGQNTPYETIWRGALSERILEKP